MTTYSWPTSKIFVPSTITLRQKHNNRAFESPQSGTIQTNSTPGSKWGWLIDFTPHEKNTRAIVEAFLTQLSGMEHRVALHDLRRPRPVGTCNLTGVTVSTTVAQFATSVTLAGCGNATTLVAGDWIKLDGQLVMVVPSTTGATTYTATSGGVMSNVQFRHMLRAAVSSGSSVTLDKPTSLYILASSSIDMPRQSGWSEPAMSIELVEVFS